MAASRRLPIIVLQQPAQPLAALDRAFGDLRGRLTCAQRPRPKAPPGCAATIYRRAPAAMPWSLPQSLAEATMALRSSKRLPGR